MPKKDNFDVMKYKLNYKFSGVKLTNENLLLNTCHPEPQQSTSSSTALSNLSSNQSKILDQGESNIKKLCIEKH